MDDKTKKLFDAPWHVEQHNRYFGPQIHAEVRNAKGALVADVGPYKASFVDANRIACLPELYDALEDAAERVCKKCVAFWFPGQKFDFPQNFADFICPITKAGCFCENWLNLLRKVRDAQ